MTGTEATSALLLGLAGAGHCMGMCGGLALAFRAPEGSRWSFPVAYHGGRLLGYASIGGFIGSVALFTRPCRTAFDRCRLAHPKTLDRHYSTRAARWRSLARYKPCGERLYAPKTLGACHDNGRALGIYALRAGLQCARLERSDRDRTFRGCFSHGVIWRGDATRHAGHDVSGSAGLAGHASYRLSEPNGGHPNHDGPLEPVARNTLVRA